MTAPIKTDVTLHVEAKEYGPRAMFMRSVRVDGTVDGKEIEVAVNELGYGIIVRYGDRQFVVNENDLIDAVIDYAEGEK